MHTIQLLSSLPDLAANITITGPGQTTLSILGGGSTSSFSVFQVDSGRDGHPFGPHDLQRTLQPWRRDQQPRLAHPGQLHRLGQLGRQWRRPPQLRIAHRGRLDDLGRLGDHLRRWDRQSRLAHHHRLDLLWRLGPLWWRINGYGSLTLTDSTITGNSAGQSGGGIALSYGVLTAVSSTIAANHAGSYGGGVSGVAGYGGLTLQDTIVAGNTAGTASTPDDVHDAASSASGFNLIGVNTGLSGIANGTNGNQVGTASAPLNPRLGPLGSYSGPTQTMPLLPGSPAIDTGSNARALDASGNPLVTDQCGFDRIANTTVDIGAFEVENLVVNTLADETKPNDSKTSLREAIALAEATGTPTILFDPTLFAIPQTITLTQGPLVLADSAGPLTLNGPGTNLLTVNAAARSGVFVVNGGTTVTISGLTITGGSASYGGGLYNSGTVTLTAVVVTGNSAFSACWPVQSRQHDHPEQHDLGGLGPERRGRPGQPRHCRRGQQHALGRLGPVRRWPLYLRPGDHHQQHDRRQLGLSNRRDLQYRLERLVGPQEHHRGRQHSGRQGHPLRHRRYQSQHGQ